jgi:hypothetical protein
VQHHAVLVGGVGHREEAGFPWQRVVGEARA